MFKHSYGTGDVGEYIRRTIIYPFGFCRVFKIGTSIFPDCKHSHVIHQYAVEIVIHKYHFVSNLRQITFPWWKSSPTEVYHASFLQFIKHITHLSIVQILDAQ